MPDKITLYPPFSKGDEKPLSLEKGGWEGFKMDFLKMLKC